MARVVCKQAAALSNITRHHLFNLSARQHTSTHIAIATLSHISHCKQPSVTSGIRHSHRLMAQASSTPAAAPAEPSCNSLSNSTVEAQSQTVTPPNSTTPAPDSAPKDWQGGTCERLPGQKRSVALHVVYVGTEFRGLQLSRDFPAETTVEGVLELALLKAGLIAPSNYGDLFKIKWTRSSRTDKGVHSLGTVIAVRIVMEGADEVFEQDREGLGIAARINEHLPSSVRVLSAQRVPKKFNARRFCADRTYEYYLPTSVLSMANDGSEVDAEKLRHFRAALALFEGRHPFHNYTVRRGQYLDTPGSIARRQAAASAASAASNGAAEGNVTVDHNGIADSNGGNGADSTALAVAVAPSSTTPQADSVATASQQQQPRPPVSSPARSKAKKGRKGKGEDEDEGEEEVEEEEAYQAALAVSQAPSGEAGSSEVVTRCWRQLCSWVHDDAMSEKDRVGVRHYRQITQFIADDPSPLIPGGQPCIRITVTGGSFMLNQIRHMIGAAVAVSGGYLSMDLVQASLSAPARVSVPKAPPHTLLLSSCMFPPFRGAGTEEPLVARYSGKALTLRKGGAAARAAFVRDVLAPELNELLDHPQWEHFTTSLSWFVWDSEAAVEVVELSKQWKAAGLAKYKQKQADAEAAGQTAGDTASAAAAGVTEADVM